MHGDFMQFMSDGRKESGRYIRGVIYGEVTVVESDGKSNVI